MLNLTEELEFFETLLKQKKILFTFSMSLPLFKCVIFFVNETNYDGRFLLFCARAQHNYFEHIIIRKINKQDHTG